GQQPEAVHEYDGLGTRGIGPVDFGLFTGGGGHFGLLSVERTVVLHTSTHPPLVLFPPRKNVLARRTVASMATPEQVVEPRERLLRTATELFYREGIHSVGVDRILAEAKVTRATMYRHFKGKEDLVKAYLALEDATIKGYFADAATNADPDTDMLALVIDG